MIEKFKSNAEAIATADKYLYGNHARMPIVMDRGEGCWVWDLDNNKYLDFVGGIAVNGLGHHHPAIVEALDRAKDMMHCSNYYYNEPAIQVCKLICENSCFEKVLFANSGAEANEGQIKLARKYAVDHGHPERYVVISMLKSFHGRTLATATATGQEIVHNPKWFSPLPEGFRYAEFNNLESVKEQMGDDVCAILTEPVQGEGGVRPASKEFLQGLRDLCDEKGILLMFDEVQVGSGRTGKLFAHQNYGVEPDTCSMAKALDGSGIPGGWGIYRLSPGGDLETVYSIPNGGRAMAFWSDGDGTLFLLTEEKGAVLLTLLDAATLTPVATQELFPAAEGAPHPQVFPQSDGSFCLLSAGDFLAVLNRRSGAWVVDFTADTSLQSSLGCPLSTPSSRLSLCYDGTRLAITGPCPSTKSEYFLAVYTADGLEYLGGYTSSLYGNHPPDCYPWGSWQDGSCRSIALEPSLPGTETAS
mgnify:CR=1 FL=1